MFSLSVVVMPMTPDGTRIHLAITCVLITAWRVFLPRYPDSQLDNNDLTELEVNLFKKLASLKTL